MAPRFLLAAVLAVAAPAQNVHHVTTAAELVQLTPRLRPGDVVWLAAGSYRLPTWSLAWLRGRADAWITFRGEGGRAAITGTSPAEPVARIEGCRYLRFEDLAFTSAAAAAGIHGVWLDGNDSAWITLDRCRVHGVTGTGVVATASLTSHLELVGCEIDHCGHSGVSLGSKNGDAKAAAAVIRGCYLHDLSRTETWAYGIHLKPRSHAARIEDNVIHDAGGTDGAGIAIYDVDPQQAVAPALRNRVTGNAVWGCGFEGIYAVNNAVLESNVVFDARYGITVDSNHGKAIVAMSVRNNTVYRCTVAGVRIDLRAAAAVGSDVLVTNNLAVAEGRTGLGYKLDSPPQNARLAGNAYLDAWTGWTYPGFAALGTPPFRSSGAGVGPGTLDLRPAHPADLAAVADRRFAPDRDFAGERAWPSVLTGAYQLPGHRPHWPIDRRPKAAAGLLSPHYQAAAGGALFLLRIDAPAGTPYAVLAGGAVWQPGTLPLLPDAWTAAAWSGGPFAGYLGVTDARGIGLAALAVPPLALPGDLTLYHAAAALEPGGLALSPPARVVLRR